MSYEDPIKSVSEGAIKGLLNWSFDVVKNLASKFKDKELAFIQDEKTIRTVKEQYNSGELAIYKEYVKDKNILFLLKMGLTLRKLEEEKEDERKKNLRNKIFDRYGVKGVHISQLVENGILNRYIGILIEGIVSLEKFKEDLRNVLENIEQHVIFVRVGDQGRNIIKQAITITSSHSPIIFIVSGIFSAAEIVRDCERKLIELLNDYTMEKISSKNKENLFFRRILR